MIQLHVSEGYRTIAFTKANVSIPFSILYLPLSNFKLHKLIILNQFNVYDDWLRQASYCTPFVTKHGSRDLLVWFVENQ